MAPIKALRDPMKALMDPMQAKGLNMGLEMPEIGKGALDTL